VAGPAFGFGSPQDKKGDDPASEDLMRWESSAPVHGREWSRVGVRLRRRRIGRRRSGPTRRDHVIHQVATGPPLAGVDDVTSPDFVQNEPNFPIENQWVSVTVRNLILPR
jgi:hypothetical protein